MPRCWDHGCNGRQFSTFSALLRHRREKSGHSTKSVCHRCGAEFTRKTALHGHLAQDKCKNRPMVASEVVEIPKHHDLEQATQDQVAAIPAMQQPMAASKMDEEQRESLTPKQLKTSPKSTQSQARDPDPDLVEPTIPKDLHRQRSAGHNSVERARERQQPQMYVTQTLQDSNACRQLQKSLLGQGKTPLPNKISQAHQPAPIDDHKSADHVEFEASSGGVPSGPQYPSHHEISLENLQAKSRKRRFPDSAKWRHRSHLIHEEHAASQPVTRRAATWQKTQGGNEQLAIPTTVCGMSSSGAQFSQNLPPMPTKDFELRREYIEQPPPRMSKTSHDDCAYSNLPPQEHLPELERSLAREVGSEKVPMQAEHGKTASGSIVDDLVALWTLSSI